MQHIKLTLIKNKTNKDTKINFNKNKISIEIKIKSK